MQLIPTCLDMGGIRYNYIGQFSVLKTIFSYQVTLETLEETLFIPLDPIHILAERL